MSLVSFFSKRENLLLTAALAFFVCTFVFLGIGINMSMKYAKGQKAAAAKGKKD